MGKNTHARSAQKKGSYHSSLHKLTVRESLPCKAIKGNPLHTWGAQSGLHQTTRSSCFKQEVSTNGGGGSVRLLDLGFVGAW